MTDEGWPRGLCPAVVEVDEAGDADWDEQKRQQGDDNAHAAQCITNINHG